MFRFFLLTLSLCGLGSARAELQRLSVDFDYVKAQAQARAAKPFAADEPPRLPRKLRDLDYERYREIEFRREAALWSGDDARPFQLEFFHRGHLNEARVRVNEFSPTHVQEIPFRTDFFNYRGLGDVGALRSSTGYAGFRVKHALNRPEAMDELLAFLGSSYFRALAPGQAYGLSARGLAVDAALPDRTEEFPRFIEFWVGKPEPDAKTLQVYALLDSPRVAGAYRFVVEPGRATVMTVEVALWWREAVDEPGWAPLTSMFWYGENTDRPAATMRPEVHDSDGWWVETAEAGRIWRPLQQVDTPLVTEVATQGLRRFGLIQRDRAFAHYQDLEAHYHQRPSVWVEPLTGWGSGRVRLSELPTKDEYADNVVAYWRPDAPIVPGQAVEFSYRLVWTDRVPPKASMPGRVIATRSELTPDGNRRFWIDFNGETMPDWEPDEFGAEVVPGAGVEVRHQALERLPEGGGWRVIAVVNVADTTELASLHCALRRGSETVSETWSLTWRP